MNVEWQKAYEEAIRCIRCGYCQPTCPTYAITGVESFVARGRNFLARSLYEGEIDFTREFKKPIFECLLCGACNENCAPVVKTQQIMSAARREYIEKLGQPPLQRYVFRELLPNPSRMTRLMKIAALGKRSGISGLAQALRIFGWIGRNIADMEDLLHTLPKRFLREEIAEANFKKEKQSARVGYFVGCGINYAFPEVGLATLNLLAKSDFSIEVLDNVCCGLPASGYGDLDAARWLAQRNIEVIERSGCDVIVSECGSCSSFLSDYKQLFEDDERWLARADAISRKVQDINVFLVENLMARNFRSSAAMTVTYHDPCHLGHYMKIKAQPRQLIRQVEGITYQELPEANWCCGGAGTYNIAHHELSLKILQRKMSNLQRTQANVLLSSCPGCLVQLSFGVRKFKQPVAVKHVVQLLNDSLVEE
ncbi:MAG: (Fe-S)-binding protein [candidate division KSB1 bacterium]|nr:(Fe-S)-binding protein [candidate division KSB1 bacterium]MDZ7340009.1 (Fe-S)-binding protein [candidate division KSB1 bacterium]